eukprot:TRINITY_DN307_c0_g1_i4.p3 TRINITY_DN307_c0_g1~~TRINITY_DN307_c0_g1_i4.p3  ORF type:complete len:194 (+),score=48.85 TRINITY_DN307_c0_g1_i4:158-739(+)
MVQQVFCGQSKLQGFGKPRERCSLLRRTRVRNLQVVSIFGGDRDWKAERDEMFEQQQEILRARRSKDPANMAEVNERRRRLSIEARKKEEDKKARRDLLEQGIRPERTEEYKPYDLEAEKGSIIIPLAPFGIPKFDNGERFDLKSPYTDEGWVDPDADPFKWFKNMWGKKQEEETEQAAEEKKTNEEEKKSVE